MRDAWLQDCSSCRECQKERGGKRTEDGEGSCLEKLRLAPERVDCSLEEILARKGTLRFGGEAYGGELVDTPAFSGLNWRFGEMIADLFIGKGSGWSP